MGGIRYQESTVFRSSSTTIDCASYRPSRTWKRRLRYSRLIRVLIRVGNRSGIVNILFSLYEGE